MERKVHLLLGVAGGGGTGRQVHLLMSEVDGEEGPSTFRCHGGMWYREAGPPINVRSGWRGRSIYF